MARRLDRVDRQLLACLQEDNLRTSDELAAVVGRSPSVIARRLRRIRGDKLIVRDSAQLSAETAGHTLSALVHVELERHSFQQADQFLRSIAASSNVQLCFEISGAFDFMLLVVAVDMDSFNAFADEMLTGHPAVRRYETAFVKKRVKATLAFPISLEDGDRR